MKTLIENISFELSISDSHSNFDYTNVRLVELFISRVEDDYNDELAQSSDAQAELAALKAKVAEHKEKTHSLSKDDIKKVYLMLKDRELHPEGEFDKAGRFWLKDAELVSVRTPSTNYPYSQMKAGRTRKFVEAIADKYNCETVEALISQFTSSK